MVAWVFGSASTPGIKRGAKRRLVVGLSRSRRVPMKYRLMMGVAIEDLTVVVLTHELAHAYTHLGRDIDGARWGDEEFDKSALEVREGLAQFYTEVICEQLAPRTPGFLAAFQALLSLQSPPYLVHRAWLS